jgi:hypothetical protein
MTDKSPACRVCGKPLVLLDKDEQRWYCYKDDIILYANRQRWNDESTISPGSTGAVSTGPPPPPVGGFDVWIPILWLLGILFFGFVAWFISIILLIGATIYVYYNSKKFKIESGLAILTLLFAIIGLPLYAWDLYKLKQAQKTQTLPAQPVLAAPIQSEETKLCRNGWNPTVKPPPLQTAPHQPVSTISDEQSDQQTMRTKFCRYCGVKIPRASKFCEECGSNIQTI